MIPRRGSTGQAGPVGRLPHLTRYQARSWMEYKPTLATVSRKPKAEAQVSGRQACDPRGPDGAERPVYQGLG